MLIKFEIVGFEDPVIPVARESSYPMKVGDTVTHYNDLRHADYEVIETKYVIDDTKPEFYQLVTLQEVNR